MRIDFGKRGDATTLALLEGVMVVPGLDVSYPEAAPHVGEAVICVPVNIEDRDKGEGAGVLAEVVEDGADVTLRGHHRVRYNVVKHSNPLRANWKRVDVSSPRGVHEKVGIAKELFLRWPGTGSDPSWEAEQRKVIAAWVPSRATAVRFCDRLAYAIWDVSLLAAVLGVSDIEEGLSLEITWLRTALTPLPQADADIAGKENADGVNLISRTDEAELPAVVRQKVELEKAMLRTSDESNRGRILDYLRIIGELPWSNKAEPPTHTLEEARIILDEDHAGMEEVKQQVLDRLASLLWWGHRIENSPAEDQPPAPPLRHMLLVGPPGTGKTTILRSIADALGRHLEVLPCGSFTDAAALSGFERSYVGARPGSIIEALRRAQTVSLVLALDEVDKMSSANSGDPFAVLMEVTDPSQNSMFTDRYLQVPFDISKVLIVATANEPSRIPDALLDRFHVINVHGYSPAEKQAMAFSHLLPRLYRALDIPSERIQIDGTAVSTLVAEYTDESGVRNLDDQLMVLLERTLPRLLTNPEDPVVIDAEAARTFLGRPRVQQLDPPLAGGSGYVPIVFVEPSSGTGRVGAIQVSLIAGEDSLILTGTEERDQIDAAQVAYSFIQNHQGDLGLYRERLVSSHIHIHQEPVDVLKDGRSLGMAFVTAMVSALRDQPLAEATSLSGEITLDGRILPVSDVSEKVAAAHRAGIGRMILPAGNADQLTDIADDVRAAMDLVTVSTIAEAIRQAFKP